MALHDFNPDFTSEINIESIISAPLVAASKANVEMLRGQTRALLENCFSVRTIPGQNGNPPIVTHEPVLIRMSLSRTVLDETVNPDGSITNNTKQVNLDFFVPLICIVPMNSLAIDKVDIDFDMEITSVTSWETDKGIISKQAQLNGKISNNSNNKEKSQYKNQSTSNLKVNIHASQLPLPVGVLTILDLYNKHIQHSISEK